MKVVNLCVSLLVLSFVVACQPKTTTSDQIADEVYQVDSLLVLQDSSPNSSAPLRIPYAEGGTGRIIP